LKGQKSQSIRRVGRIGQFGPFVLIAVGVLLAGAGVLVSNAALESALLSDPTRTLGWGATLFRLLLVIHGLAMALAGIIWCRRTDVIPPLASPPTSVTDRSSTAVGRMAWVVLIGLSVLGLGLRLWRLNSDLWHDEVLTLLDFARRPIGEILTSFPSQNQHMFFSVLARLSFGLFGESAWALRLPSVIFGVASLWALFMLGRQLLGTREALLACSLMTVSYHHIWFSQNARGYMGLLFFTLLATWLWLEALSRETWSWWIGYAVAVALGAWCHMTMAFVAAAHVLISFDFLIKPRVRGRGTGSIIERVNWRPVVGWLLCASLTLQLHALALPEFLKSGLHEVSLPSEWTNPIWVITESMRSLRVGFSSVFIVLFGGVMVGIGWLSMFRRNWRAALALILPAALAGGTMLALGHNLWPRFFFFSMGFALLIVVEGAMALPRLLLPRKSERIAVAAGVVLVCFIIVASAATVPRNYRLPKQDFTGARDYVERHRQPGDAVVAVGLAGADYGGYFAPHWSVAQTSDELEAIRQKHAMVWLVYTLPIEVKAYHSDVWGIIENDFEVVRVFPGTLGGGEVYVCRHRPKTVPESSRVSTLNQNK
jgi:hypothetical protein